MMNKRIAIYPGTFDPITNAHIDLLERGLHLFDQITLAIAPNPGKGPAFSTEERVRLAREAIEMRGLKGVEIEPFEGLLVDYVQSKKANIIIRGLRAVSDFEYEFQMALMNRKLAPEVETIYMMPSENFTFLSSHMVKEVTKLGGELTDLVPANVLKALKEKYGIK
jgi:pantetheine-phosphate adenylyltransferase